MFTPICVQCVRDLSVVVGSSDLVQLVADLDLLELLLTGELELGLHDLTYHSF